METPGIGRDDRELMTVAIAELKQIARGRPVPVVRLIDRHPWFAQARGCPARIEIRRALAARGPLDALRFEIAREYAHFLEPDRLRGLALSPLAASVGAAGLMVWLTAGVGSSVAHSQRLLWVCLVVVGLMFLGAALYLQAPRFHRRELCADALAAELLGGSGPGLAWFDEAQARHQRLGRMARFDALFTHPSPTRRRRELLAGSSTNETRRRQATLLRWSGHGRATVLDRGSHR